MEFLPYHVMNFFFTDPGLHKVRHSSLVCCHGPALFQFLEIISLLIRPDGLNK